MRGNVFGKLLSMTTFGESHGPYMGVVLDGLPPQMPINLDELHSYMKRRAPGQQPGVTSRKEEDYPQIIAGVFEGVSTGAPLTVLVPNTNQKSKDYDQLKNEFRPGHADHTTLLKYGVRDHRGGGRSSGRETVARVIAGYFAQKILPSDMIIRSFVSKLGPFKLEAQEFPSIEQLHSLDLGRYSLPSSCRHKDDEIENFLLKCKASGESVGGEITTIVENPVPGLGEPVFDKLKADLAKGILSIGACTSFSYGLGHEMAYKMGSEISTDLDHFGGIEGGISNGRPISLRCTFRPTSTVGEKAKQGRHDPCVLPRACVVVESMVSFILADHYLRQLAYREFLK